MDQISARFLSPFRFWLYRQQDFSAAYALDVAPGVVFGYTLAQESPENAAIRSADPGTSGRHAQGGSQGAAAKHRTNTECHF